MSEGKNNNNKKKRKVKGAKSCMYPLVNLRTFAFTRR